MDRLPAAFSKRPLVSSRWSEHPSAPRWPLALLAMVSTHTTTSTTITTHLSMASTLAVAEAAADELLHIGEPRSTIVSPTAYARSAYSRMPVMHHRLYWLWPIEYEKLLDDHTLVLTSILWRSPRRCRLVTAAVAPIPGPWLWSQTGRSCWHRYVLQADCPLQLQCWG